jgi:hypothetical protein
VIENSVDLSTYCGECFPNWETIGDLGSIAEHYLVAKPHIHVHPTLWLGFWQWETDQLCALFYSLAGRHHQCRRFLSRLFDEDFGANLYPFEVSSGREHTNEAVFISVIKLPQDRKQVVPSLVWLRPLEKCFQFSRQPANVLGTGGLLEGSFGFKDGKVNVPVKGRIADNVEVPQQMVEGRAEIIADIADDEAKVGGDWASVSNVDDTVSSITLSYFTLDKVVGLGIVEPLEGDLKCCEVVIRSPELLERAMHR